MRESVGRGRGSFFALLAHKKRDHNQPFVYRSILEHFSRFGRFSPPDRPFNGGTGY